MKSLRKENIPLRERKPAQIKLNLLKATLERMKDTSFAQIAVKDLCAQVQVSEPTFFKYFPRKTDLLIYFFELWSIEVAARALKAEGSSSGLTAIEEIFDFTARKFDNNPRLMLEVISLLAAARTPFEFPPLSRAERIIAFAGLPQALEIDPQPLEEIFEAYVARAVEHGELPASIDKEFLVTVLVSYFVGVPLTRKKNAPQALRFIYRRLLKLLWRSVYAEESPVV